jgi:tetratricopeptide (TPR) repeat protein
MKRAARIIILCAALAAPAVSLAAAPDAARGLMQQADAAVKAGRWDDAIKLSEQVISNHPEAVNSWPAAELDIAKALAQKGDLAGALQAAHLCLDGAMSPQTFDSTVMFAAQIMSAQDKNVDRANQYINFALQGGKTNPMDAVGYPAMPDREKAFAAMRPQAGDDAAASRLRAFTYIFAGKPKDALAQFAEAFRRCSNTSDLQRAAEDLVFIGLRDVRGNRVGLDAGLQFVMYGPSGPDGKPGTADDIVDPFAAYLSPAPKAGQGGLSGIDPAALPPLQQVYDAARLYAGDALLFDEIRHPALVALARATSALDGWGAPGQKDWYLDLALGRNGLPRPKPSTASLLVTGAEWAARGRDYHLGGIDAVWQAIDADAAAQNQPTDKPVEVVHNQFLKLRAGLGKVSFPTILLRPLTAPATF